MQSKEASYRFATLDGLRGVAALCVMSMHITTATRHPVPPLASLAVDLFFILSGFVLSHAYEQRILDGTMTFNNFVLRRIIRLFPVYILSIALGTASMMALHGHSASTYSRASILISAALNGLFLPYPNHGVLDIVGLKVPGLLFPSNIAAWSLFFEMSGSLALWAFIRFRTWLLALITLAAILCLVIYGTWPELHRLPPGFINVGFLSANFGGGFLRVGYGMTLGVLLYRVFTALDRRRKPDLKPSRFTTVSIALYLGVVASFSFAFQSHEGLYELLVVVIWAPSVVLMGACTQTSGLLYNLDEWLGRLSYPIYCLHVPIVVVYYHTGLTKAGDNWSVLPCAGLIILVSAIVAKFWDEPVRARLARMLFSRPVRAPVLQTT